jgi:hypothetical protein
MAVDHCEGTMSCQDIYPNGTKKQKPDNLKSFGIVLTKKQAEKLGGFLQSIAAKSADEYHRLNGSLAGAGAGA